MRKAIKKSAAFPQPSMKKTIEEISPQSLARRVSRLEEDDRLQKIMIGIIMVPLAVLALLGAAPIP